MRFEILMKEFKTLTEKAVTCISKKAPFVDLTRICLEVTEKGILKVKASDIEQYIVVTSEIVFGTEPGFCTIDNEDLKVINKLSGIISVTKEENKLIFDNGKKKLFIPCYDTYEITFPELKEQDTKTVLETEESWLLETLVKLDTFTLHVLYNNRNNISMKCFNFNTKYNRIEALDSHRIAIRKLDDCSCILGTKKQETEYLLLNTCVPVFKKVLDKKSNNAIGFYTDGKYNKFCGTNFTYYSKCVNAHYFKVENMLYTSNYKQSCIVKRENLMEIAKYNKDLVNSKEDKKPMVLKCKNDTLYSYMKTSRYETLDSIETYNLNIKEDFEIAFNPAYIFEGLNIMETEDVKIDLYNSKAPVLMTCEEYQYLLLPVHI